VVSAIRFVDGVENNAECDDTDSQDHRVHYCTHPNVKAIRGATKANLDTLTMQFTEPDSNTNAHYEIHARLVGEINNMIDSVECPSRIWTTNWNTNMIQKLSDTLNLRTVNIKLQASLRRTVINVGTILAEGAREILEVRHTIQSHRATV